MSASVPVVVIEVLEPVMLVALMLIASSAVRLLSLVITSLPTVTFTPPAVAVMLLLVAVKLPLVAITLTLASGAFALTLLFSRLILLVAFKSTLPV
ncbi:hypothetical protein CJP74_00430 [Psittacicella melopsittaci]|uniref:Uncharacterized protein n=2 Tax=Psittacicella melopsittaci TaxID=2028576 RepID=A0A3A1Y9Z2_9GAMM|nr:hypothetical protein CJP74_00430 [Psittacicella melopsittaci]